MPWSNMMVEGAIIEWADTNRYHQAESWLVFNIPGSPHRIRQYRMLSSDVRDVPE